MVDVASPEITHLIHSWIKKHKGSLDRLRQPYDDFTQDVLVKIFKYGISDKYALSTNIYNHCDWTLRDLLIERHNRGREQREYEDIGYKDPASLFETREELANIVSRAALSGPQRKYLDLKIKGLGTNAIAQSLKCSRQWVLELNGVCLRKLKIAKDIIYA